MSALPLTALGLTLLALTAGGSSQTLTGQTRPYIRQYVMAPLHPITDWAAFRRQLIAIKQLGVEAITTDIWWSLVEPEEGKFDWSYYRRYAELVQEVGLKWVPILSFHQCGGNVGDSYDLPLRDWVLKKFSSPATNRFGHQNRESLEPLQPKLYDAYEKVMQSFRREFWHLRHGIEKIYIGGGPAGEVRFPSYSFGSGWVYPGIGTFQASSAHMRRLFADYLRLRYEGNIRRLNDAWGSHFSSFFDPSLMPPLDEEQFFRTGRQTTAGQDFLSFYQSVLEEHAFELMARARRVFQPFAPLSEGENYHRTHFSYGFGQQVGLDPNLHPLGKPQFPKPWNVQRNATYWYLRSLKWRAENSPQKEIPEAFLQGEARLGAKLAGIHWQRSNPVVGGGAEQAAGYVDYSGLLAVWKAMGFGLTFTAMEMTDAESGYPAFSTPRALVGEIASLAQQLNIPLSGENALGIGGNREAFTNIRTVFGEEKVHAFTLLRWNDLVTEHGELTDNAEWYLDSLLLRLPTTITIYSDFRPGRLAAAGLELRVVGDVKELGDGDAARGVPLHYVTGTGLWTSSVPISDACRIRYWVVLYRPATGEWAAVSPEFGNRNIPLFGIEPRLSGHADAGCPGQLLNQSPPELS